MSVSAALIRVGLTGSATTHKEVTVVSAQSGLLHMVVMIAHRSTNAVRARTPVCSIGRVWTRSDRFDANAQDSLPAKGENASRLMSALWAVTLVMPTQRALTWAGCMSAHARPALRGRAIPMMASDARMSMSAVRRLIPAM